MKKKIIYKDKSEIKNIHESWKYLTEILWLLYKEVKPWVNLLELEKIAENYMVKNNIRWAFKWYYDFPANLCLSVNDCLVHGIPDNYVLQAWDLLKVDCWVIYKNGISDSAFSIIVWWEFANPEWFKLIQTTIRWLDNWYNTEKTIKDEGFSIIKTLTGHGVWRYVHEFPYIYNVANDDLKKLTRKPWMVVALEPITSLYSTKYTNISVNKNNPDNWRNLYTKEWDIWAQREYTIAITDSWPQILAWLQNVM